MQHCCPAGPCHPPARGTQARCRRRRASASAARPPTLRMMTTGQDERNNSSACGVSRSPTLPKPANNGGQ
eukprot:5471169-Lingulodinium_polyedra.AAC.1